LRAQFETRRFGAQALLLGLQLTESSTFFLQLRLRVQTPALGTRQTGQNPSVLMRCHRMGSQQLGGCRIALGQSTLGALFQRDRMGMRLRRPDLSFDRSWGHADLLDLRHDRRPRRRSTSAEPQAQHGGQPARPR
jgi:hypothetical protein